jgi:hypothetical protein
MKDERERFLKQEWPRVHATIQRLGLSAAELLDKEPSGPATPPLPTRTEHK